ncbi:hypothetical protein OIU79_002404 [Salix purpurea]|uniref:Disease resistance RPP13-like protein 1 n=1 Tax=Salix purpurea TaxID=77065 RepID=A0A9Q0US27_SALPP|nr:hypothetical protein OIU79_002404 [Salix purpurea]
METIAVEIGKAFLSSAVDYLIKEYGSALIESFFEHQNHDDKGLLEKLKETLNAVNGLLDDAEEKQITVEAVKIWLDDIKDAVYEAEDLLDEIDYEARSPDQMEAGSQTRTAQMRSFLSCCLSPPSNNLVEKELAENLKKIFNKLDRSEKTAHTIHLITRVGGKRSYDPRSRCLPTTSCLGGYRVHGRHDEKQAIMDLLLSDDAKIKGLEVIAIFGMGGIGKTTLAKCVYDDRAVKEWFDLKTWVHVSQVFDALKLTKDILKGVGLLDCDTMNPEQLHCELEKKSGARGSKIVVTTSKENIMTALQNVSPYHLQLMSADDCWSLFSEYAFSGENCNARSLFEETFLTRDEDIKSVGGIDEVHNLRTFMPMSTWGWSNKGFNSEEIHNFLPRFKRLRVLSLSGYDNAGQLLDSFGNLKHLRFLNLSRTSMDKLPEVLCASYNLQTLIMSGCKKLVGLPAKMTMLTNLYHLDITETGLQDMPPQIGKLRRLHLLTDFFVGTPESSNIKELGELQALKGELRIWNLQNVLDPQDASGANLGGKRNLKTLSLVWRADTGNSPHQQGILEQLQPHKDVEALSIDGYGGEILPKWVGDSYFSKLASLSLVEFKYCRFLPPLGQLSSLKTLLIKAWDGVEIIGPEFYGRCISTNNPFKSLQTLIFERMPQWHEWVLYDDDKAFPRLQVLQIRECPKLSRALPNHLPSLMELEIKGCPQLVLSLPMSPIINKMMLSNDYAEVKLVKLSSGYSLRLFSFQALQYLPKKMGKLGCDSTTLLSIDIVGVTIKWLPLMFFPRLKQLTIWACLNLESLCVQEEPCSHSESTSSSLICQSPHLEKLSLHNCPKLKSFHCFLPSLVDLKIYHCDGMESFPRVGSSSKLESLKIQGCHKLLAGRKQWNLQRFPSLSRFCFGACEEVESFPEEGMLLPSTLTSLGIRNLRKLKSLDCKGLQHLTSLRELIIKYCSKLQPIPEGSLPSSVSEEIWDETDEYVDVHNKIKININPLRRSPLRSPGGGMASPVSSYHQSPVSPIRHSPIPPYAYSPFMRPTLSASQPAKSVPNSPAHLTGSPHYSPSSNKVSRKSYEKLRRPDDL